jgi:hypothetical protein
LGPNDRSAKIPTQKQNVSSSNEKPKASSTTSDGKLKRILLGLDMIV